MEWTAWLPVPLVSYELVLSCKMLELHALK